MSRAVVLLALLAPAHARTVDFASSDASDRSVDGMLLHSRFYVPFDAGNNYGYGMGAAEQIAYDKKEMKAYAISEQGFVNIVDYSSGAPMWWGALDLSGGGSLTDVIVCPDKSIVAVAQVADAKTDPGVVHIFTAASGSSGGSSYSNSPLHTYAVGSLPDMIEANADCSKIAVANEGEAKLGDDGVLTDPVGSVSIIDLGKETVDLVAFDSVLSQFDDETLLTLGVHMALPEAARDYWGERDECSLSLLFR